MLIGQFQFDLRWRGHESKQKRKEGAACLQEKQEKCDENDAMREE
jgi:hypothetical protein